MIAPGLSAQELEAVNRRLAGDMAADGYAMLSSTVLGGRTTLRLCTINPRTAEDEIAETVRRLRVCAQRG